jgi:hypothetical protein
VKTVKVIVAGHTGTFRSKLSLLSFESDSILYHMSSLFLVPLLRINSLSESKGLDSFDWSLDNL